MRRSGVRLSVRPSVRLSVPSIDSSSGAPAARLPCYERRTAGADAQQQMRAAPRCQLA